MRIIQVTTKKLFRAFLNVPALIYAHDEEYVFPIRQEITKILWDRKKPENVGLYLLKNGTQYVGRIAAFVNKGDKGGLGFFECIDDKEAAFKLFQTGIDWLKQKDTNFVEAPVNYGERDKFWGLMVKGFNSPSYQENYNPPYYQGFFEAYGFEKSITQSTQEISPEGFNFDKLSRLAERVARNQNLSVRHIEKNNLVKYAKDFTDIYNTAWITHEHFVPLTYEKVHKTMQSMKPVLREDLVWFTYDGDRPIAFYVSIIEVNEIFKHLRGNLNWWGKLKFLYLKKTKPVRKIRGLVFGVVPSHQGLGVAAGMMMKVFDIFKKDPYLKTSELAWIGDFNPRMLQLMRSIGAVEIKQHITYQKKI